MKLLFMAFLATWTMKILPCSLVIHLQAEQHAEIKGKTIEDILRFKYQKMEELKNGDRGSGGTEDSRRFGRARVPSQS